MSSPTGNLVIVFAIIKRQLAESEQVWNKEVAVLCWWGLMSGFMHCSEWMTGRNVHVNDILEEDN